MNAKPHKKQHDEQMTPEQNFWIRSLKEHNFRLKIVFLKSIVSLCVMYE